MELKKRANLVFLELSKNYVIDSKDFLSYKTDAQMLCAIMLSAQSTDAQINKITSTLFKKYKTVNDFANAKKSVFEKEIKSSGYYKQKANRIITSFKIIKTKHNGKIPLSMDELIKLPGVGRKTANLVLAKKGIISGVAVDTHVWRVSQRLGFTKFDYQDKIEKDLMKLFDKKKWGLINGLFILHGRKICKARKPLCEDCFLFKKKLCFKKGV